MTESEWRVCDWPFDMLRHLNGKVDDKALTAEAAVPIFEEWDRAYQTGEAGDLAGGSTHDAIESVCGVGFGHAAQVAKACFESAGYAASHSLRVADASQPDITTAWLAAELAERLAQCQILRESFGYRPDLRSKDAELDAPVDGGA